MSAQPTIGWSSCVCGEKYKTNYVVQYCPDGTTESLSETMQEAQCGYKVGTKTYCYEGSKDPQNNSKSKEVCAVNNWNGTLGDTWLIGYKDQGAQCVVKNGVIGGTCGYNCYFSGGEQIHYPDTKPHCSSECKQDNNGRLWAVNEGGNVSPHSRVNCGYVSSGAKCTLQDGTYCKKAVCLSNLATAPKPSGGSSGSSLTPLNSTPTPTPIRTLTPTLDDIQNQLASIASVIYNLLNPQ
ncbi:MAG: hypothetical protein A2510_01180 [Candidatus Staskawiczbacteria bacterium RIFOXYD12_FULL_37_10]|nr:MAG: hypothetical protein A2510_01180 [Candidatus Staskawiczbacteria bacterium RIFOXYD12_FULL_37_10]